MQRVKAKPGDRVELSNKDVGFYDPETGLQLVRDQEAELGDTIGHKTNLALSSGALLIVESKPRKKSTKKTEDSKGSDSDLPEDLPGRDAFIEAGLSLEKIESMGPENLDKVKGVGAKTIEALAEYFAGNQGE